MRTVEQDQLKEKPEQAESRIAEDGIVSHETTIKNVDEKVTDSEISRPAFRRRLWAQYWILIVIGGIVAWLIVIGG